MTIMRQLIRLTTGLFILLLSTQILASDDVVIDLSVEGCNVNAQADNNGCDASQCSGDPACVCAKKGQFLLWQIATSDKFKIIFSGNDPLRDNCGKNYKGGKHKCKIKEEVNVGEEYSYIIKLERCDDGSDPRVVIRGG